jgi:diguanylate cyclase (GGDEF)-like protein
MVQRLATERQKAEGVRRRASTAGKLGAFLGDMAGGTSDPLVMLTLPFGASASAGILRTALTEAALASGTEVTIQPQVFDFKQDIGSPYSVGQAAGNVALAGIGAGAFSAVLKSLPFGYRALLTEYRKRRAAGELPAPNTREQAAEQFLDRLANEQDSNPYQRDLPDSQDVHAQNLRTADEHVADGEIVPEDAIQRPAEVPRETAPGAIERRQNLKKRQEVEDLQARVSDLQKRIDDGTATPGELKQALSDLDKALHTSDVAPMLQNQRAFNNVMRGKKNAPVLFFDLDNFKLYNDRFSHSVGDQLIAATGQLAKDVADDMGVPIFHKSGDEFLGGDGAIDAATLQKLGENIQKRLSTAKIKVRLDDGSVRDFTDIRLSYGVGSGKNIKNSVDAAEKALQADKARRAAAGLRTDRLDDVSGKKSRAASGGNNKHRVPKPRKVTRAQVKQVEELHEQLHKQPDLLDETLDAETARLLEEDPDLIVPIDERLDPDTGEAVAATLSARELLAQADEEKAAAQVFTECAIGGAEDAA